MGSNRLTEGSIWRALVRLSLPIMSTSFVQMAYNMTDMIWIGRIGSKAVAGVGTAGFFTWLAMAFILIPKIGAEVGVAQSTGKKDVAATKAHIVHALQIGIFLAFLYSIPLILFKNQLIGFFNLGDTEVISMAETYLVITAFGMIFNFMNPVFTAILNGYGNSSTPFYINVIGLVVNMVLDPVLILGVGPFPAMGVAGAAIATVGAQFLVMLVFLFRIKKIMPLFKEINIAQKPDREKVISIFKLGIPAALQSGCFTIFAMIIARIIAQWGPVAIAVQKIGSQIEAVSWMTAGGFSTALSAFVGQNYGAGKHERIYRGYFVAMGIVGAIGVLTTVLLIFGAKPIFSRFIDEQEAITYGVVYLKILGISQFFMCMEIATAGAFNGLGKTVPPAIIGILLNALRIPAALILSNENLLGLNGVWWSISISSILKGIILTTWFALYLGKNYRVVNVEAKYSG
ncbi:putative MATE family efflux protein [Anaerosolibacter carboniphilus]|uniref:Probable multidrug resistance protein NorM n=1 Tax=Anaerosolibacter carboniphilus TaxID=1417629 RepID=A0A841KM02_9FIRM|nr:MATE family efflux transporter [Anaerosolibacter carboniphilus]MBB6214456.1 putative MATE family efflux protein [Anaerosolibacter carboniphilus]